MFGAYLTGHFGQSQQLYDARNAEKRGRGNAATVEEQIRRDTVLVLERQAELSFITDPQFRVDYLFQPLAEHVPGVAVGKQENWFNNNLFYRWPVLEQSIDTSVVGFTESYLDLPALTTTTKGMVVLPSPYTILELADLPQKVDRRAVLRDFATIIRNEAQHLADKGIRRIQYDEPAFVHRATVGQLTSAHYDLLAEAMEICGRIEGASTSLHTYFGAPQGHQLPFLSSLNVDCIGIDATETPLKSILAQRFEGKELALGLVNARSAAMENPQQLADTARRVADACRPKALWVTPNTGTEYIGWTFGMQKLDILTRTLALVNHG